MPIFGHFATVTLKFDIFVKFNFAIPLIMNEVLLGLHTRLSAHMRSMRFPIRDVCPSHFAPFLRSPCGTYGLRRDPSLRIHRGLCEAYRFSPAVLQYKKVLEEFSRCRFFEGTTRFKS